MNNQDLPWFTHFFMGICEIYQRNTNEVFIELYWRALQHFELKAVEAAFNAHIQDPDHGNRMPLPADIIRLLEGNRYTQASQAWSKVVSAIQHIGTWETVVFDDVIIHVVIEEMGGWIALCQLKQNDLSYRLHEFIKRYSSYILHKPTDYPNRLCGLIEQHNQQRGLAHQTPFLIGNKSFALEIFQAGRTTKNIKQQIYQTSEKSIQLEHLHEKIKK